MLTPIRESWKKNIQKSGTELALFLEKKSNEKLKNRVLGTEPASFLKKKSRVFSWVQYHDFKKAIFWELSQRHFWKKIQTFSWVYSHDFFGRKNFGYSRNVADRG